MSREYILEKQSNTTRNFQFGSVEIIQVDRMPDNIDVFKIFKTLEDHFPQHYFAGLEGVKVINLPEFKERNITAIYKNNWMYLCTDQESPSDLLNDIVHELAHHIETTHEEFIYDDHIIAKEFVDKRKMLQHELRSEGYWTDGYDFSSIEYSKSLDDFLYNRIGGKMLNMITSGLFLRPYSAVSLREYFATGFEAYYSGDKDSLYKISPQLYNRIDKLNNQ